MNNGWRMEAQTYRTNPSSTTRKSPSVATVSRRGNADGSMGDRGGRAAPDVARSSPACGMASLRVGGAPGDPAGRRSHVVVSQLALAGHRAVSPHGDYGEDRREEDAEQDHAERAAEDRQAERGTHLGARQADRRR